MEVIDEQETAQSVSAYRHTELAPDISQTRQRLVAL